MSETAKAISQQTDFGQSLGERRRAVKRIFATNKTVGFGHVEDRISTMVTSLERMVLVTGFPDIQPLDADVVDYFRHIAYDPGVSTSPWVAVSTGLGYSSIVKDVNRYFLFREAEVVRDEHAHELLLELYEAMQDGQPLTYEALGLNRSALALARLAMAGFCELSEDNVKINEHGLKFVDAIVGE
jgi:hypothetical protein